MVKTPVRRSLGIGAKTDMGSKFKVAGLLALGAVAGALTTMQLQATARNSLASLPLEDIQRLTDVFERIKADYVEPVDEKKLISDAITGMVADRRRGQRHGIRLRLGCVDLLRDGTFCTPDLQNH